MVSPGCTNCYAQRMAAQFRRRSRQHLDLESERSARENQKIQAAGSDLKLCVTEFGWPTAEGLKGKLRDGFGFVSDNTAQDQATFIDQALTEMQQGGYVRLAFLFNMHYGILANWQLDGPTGDNVPWSIMGPNWQPRPIWQKIVDRNFRGQPRKASQ